MRKRFLCLLVLVVLLLAACGGKKGATKASPTASGAAPSESATPVLCPLTGVAAPSGAQLDRPALAVKIDNAPPARPQAGLQQADIVYEEESEGGLTRLLSIFHCNDADNVGPIRSARVVDPDVLGQYAPALFSYSGANSQVLAKVAAAKGVVNLVQGLNGDAYRRDSGRKAPYNLFSSTAKLRALPAAKGAKGPPKSGFEFDPSLLTAPAAPAAPASPGAPAPAPAASSVTFAFSNTNSMKYTYDPASKAYLRFHGDVPHKTASGDQVKVVNVVILKVKITPGSIKDASGSPTQDTSIIGTGDATVLRAGTVVTGKWDHQSADSALTLSDPSGQPIKLAPGNTWVELVPVERPVTVQ